MSRRDATPERQQATSRPHANRNAAHQRMSRGPSASVHDEVVARENPDCALGYRQQRWERRSTLPTLLVWTRSVRLAGSSSGCCFPYWREHDPPDAHHARGSSTATICFRVVRRASAGGNPLDDVPVGIGADHTTAGGAMNVPDVRPGAAVLAGVAGGGRRARVDADLGDPGVEHLDRRGARHPEDMDACQAEEVAGAHACRVVVARALRRRPPTMCAEPRKPSGNTLNPTDLLDF
jgi:hypothetical protein